MYTFTAWEITSLKSITLRQNQSVHRATCPVEAPGKNLFIASFLWPHHSNLCLCGHTASSSVLNLPLPLSYKDTCNWNLDPPGQSRLKILSLILPLQKSLFLTR